MASNGETPTYGTGEEVRQGDIVERVCSGGSMVAFVVTRVDPNDHFRVYGQSLVVGRQFMSPDASGLRFVRRAADTEAPDATAAAV